MYISQAYADQKKKLNLLLKSESKPLITAIQKSFLSNENPLTIKASNYMGPCGNRIRRFENLKALLNRDPLDGEDGYTHSWSSLASSADGQTIVTLDYSGKPRWYEVKEHDQEQNHDPVIPASKCTFVERINDFSQSDHGNLLPHRHPAYRGLELVESTTSRATSCLLLKSRKSYQLQNALISEDNSLATQIIANITLDERDILDGCILSNGIAGVYDYLAMIDSFGKVYIRNVDNLHASISRNCIIGNLEDLDSSSSQDQKSCWASIKGSCNGDHLFASTRKIVKLFDLRSRPHEGNYSKIFSIPISRENESSSEMIGGILNNHKASEGLLYFCSNLRIGAVDKRMPGRVYSQVQLYNSPSFSKKVALPSGLTSFSTMCQSNDNPSRLDYLAAWMPYSSSSQSNHPSAIVTCFDQSYNFCVCRNSSFNRLRISSLEECHNGDHTDISTAPLIIRGKPLRIGGPQCCIDFSNEQLSNRLSLPCTGSVITKLHASKFNGASDLSILTTNVAGDIFMTALSENKEQDYRTTSSNKHFYDWKHIGSENITLTDKTEQLREELINKWWITESTFKDESSKSSNVEIEMRFGHLKTANRIFKLKPNACLNSNPELKSMIEEGSIDSMFVTKYNRRKFSKEYKLLARSEGRLDSLGRVNYAKSIAYATKIRKKKELKLIRQEHIKKVNNKRWNSGEVRTATSDEISDWNRWKLVTKACPSLKAICPDRYSGPQGIRAKDQLSSNEIDSSLRVSRKKYYTSNSENDKTSDIKYEYYTTKKIRLKKPTNYKCCYENE